MHPGDQNRVRLPREIWALGLVSLFMDVASETVHGLLPVFLVTVLGASVTSVGVLEGLAEGAALALKVFSGPFSDWMGRRKPFALAGYAMGALSKPLFALATSVPFVYGARLFDRFGKGIRGAPRDALVADIAPPEIRGAAFGLRQSLDTVGAFIGPLFAILLMWLSGNDYRLVFWIATVPGLIAVFILFWGVREPEPATPSPRLGRGLKLTDLRRLRSAFWMVAAAGAVFQLARFSEAFLILRAKDIGLALELAPLVLIVMNIVYSLSSYPVGLLSDRVRREWFLLAGLLVLCLSDLTLALGQDLPWAFAGIALWGLHMGLTQGTLAALVADQCPADLRGTAYGLFNLLSALALLLASSIAGILWDKAGSKMTFLAGAGLALLSGLAYLASLRIGRRAAEAR